MNYVLLPVSVPCSYLVFAVFTTATFCLVFAVFTTATLCLVFAVFTTATFGLASNDDYASFTVPDTQRAALQTSLTLSFFLRTRRGSAGLLAYVGGDESDPPELMTYIAVSLHESRVRVQVYLDGTLQELTGPEV